MSMTIDQDFPGKASDCNKFFFFFLSRSVDFNSARHNIMGKDAQKGRKVKQKAKPAPAKGLKAEIVPMKIKKSRNRRTA